MILPEIQGLTAWPAPVLIRVTAEANHKAYPSQRPAYRQYAQPSKRARQKVRAGLTLSKAGKPEDTDGTVREADCEDCPKRVGRGCGQEREFRSKGPSGTKAALRIREP